MNSSERECFQSFRAAGYEILFGGWPDFLIVDGNRGLGLELKRRPDRLNSGQRRMHAALNQVGLQVRVAFDDEWRRFLKTYRGIRPSVSGVPVSRAKLAALRYHALRSGSPAPDSGIITIDELARLWGVKPSVIWSLVAKGLLPPPASAPRVMFGWPAGVANRFLDSLAPRDRRARPTSPE
jgi:predicted DNA-binding transcriptional regulator AlpA